MQESPKIWFVVFGDLFIQFSMNTLLAPDKALFYPPPPPPPHPRHAQKIRAFAGKRSSPESHSKNELCSPESHSKTELFL